MSNFGIEISQSGVPVSEAADSQKVLDSAWEYMNIHTEESVDVQKTFTAAGVACIPLVSHDLAFLPAYSVQINSHTNADNSDFTIGFLANNKSTYLVVQYLQISTSTLSLAMNVSVRIFDVDITREYKAPIDNATPSVKSRESDYGAFVVANGGTMNSTNIEDYTLNTNAKAMCIQQHGIVAPSNGVITLEHDFGAPPTFAVARYYETGIDFGVYGKPLGSDPVIATINSTEGLGTADGKTLTLTGAQAGLDDTTKFGYLLFKDPLGTDL